MSDKLSMPAVDKVQIKVQVKAATFIRLENMSSATNLSISALCGAMIDEATSKVDMSTSDIQRMNALIQANINRRNLAKAKKGIK